MENENKPRIALLLTILAAVLVVLLAVVFLKIFLQTQADQKSFTDDSSENVQVEEKLTEVEKAQKIINELYAKDDLTPEEHDQLLDAMHVIDLAENKDKAPELPMELDEANRIVDKLYTKDELTPDEESRLFAALAVVDLVKEPEENSLPESKPSESEVLEAKKIVDQYHAKDDLTAEELDVLTDALIVIDLSEQ